MCHSRLRLDCGGIPLDKEREQLVTDPEHKLPLASNLCPPFMAAAPANTNHLYTIYTMLGQRRRRWAGVVYMLYKCFVFAGASTCLLHREQAWKTILCKYWVNVGDTGQCRRYWPSIDTSFTPRVVLVKRTCSVTSTFLSDLNGSGFCHHASLIFSFLLLCLQMACLWPSDLNTLSVGR